MARRRLIQDHNKPVVSQPNRAHQQVNNRPTHQNGHAQNNRVSLESVQRAQQHAQHDTRVMRRLYINTQLEPCTPNHLQHLPPPINRDVYLNDDYNNTKENQIPISREGTPSPLGFDVGEDNFPDMSPDELMRLIASVEREEIITTTAQGETYTERLMKWKRNKHQFQFHSDEDFIWKGILAHETWFSKDGMKSGKIGEKKETEEDENPPLFHPYTHDELIDQGSPQPLDNYANIQTQKSIMEMFFTCSKIPKLKEMKDLLERLEKTSEEGGHGREREIFRIKEADDENEATESRKREEQRRKERENKVEEDGLCYNHTNYCIYFTLFFSN